jgi:thiosulfate dehydrogenase (quinone) large subunit
MTSTEKTNERALAFLRIAVGIFFVVLAEYKVFGTEFTLGGGFRSSVQSFLSQGEAYPFMRPLLGLMLAHGTLVMAFLVAYGEFAIGLSLIVGVLSRLASVFGFALMVGIWLSSGYPGAHAAFWMYWGASLSQTVFALCFLVLVFGRAEECWSLRGFLKARVGK